MGGQWRLSGLRVLPQLVLGSGRFRGVFIVVCHAPQKRGIPLPPTALRLLALFLLCCCGLATRCASGARVHSASHISAGAEMGERAGIAIGKALEENCVLQTCMFAGMRFACAGHTLCL